MNRVPDLTSEIQRLAEQLWDYHRLNQTLEPAEGIFVLGTEDTSVAVRGAQLVLAGLAPLLIVSGGYGKITHGTFNEPEGVVFARIAEQMGVPARQIIVESRATNTGENIAFMRALLRERGLWPERFTAVQKPYMERRALAALEQQWPEVTWQVTSPQVSFPEYLAQYDPVQTIQLMVGNTQRLRVYAEQGFQKPQNIPAEVWQAYEMLVKAGFTRFLVQKS